MFKQLSVSFLAILLFLAISSISTYPFQSLAYAGHVFANDGLGESIDDETSKESEQSFEEESSGIHAEEKEQDYQDND
ncbi:MAG: hypothetical protein KDD56_02940 [Bdellovibrionales bacterium]|nr:hypothetical protein [Bdellovibrionales bacterium]